MSVHRLLLTGAIVAGSVGALPANHAAAAAPPPVAAATTGPIAQTGVALGVQTNFENDPLVDTYGRYATSGQLGSGTYRFIDFHAGNPFCGPGNTLTMTADAELIRSDGALLTGDTTITEPCFDDGAGSISIAATVARHLGDDHDALAAHLVFEGRRSAPVERYGEWFIDTALTIRGDATFTHPIGYRMVGTRGTVHAFGGVAVLGHPVTAGVTDIESTADSRGYWIVDGAGHVFAFGDATAYGNAPTLAAGETVTDLSATPSGHGYWLYTNRGRVLRFGDAQFFGDMSGVRLNGPVIDAIATPTGRGYLMVASDGGVFAFGDAVFRGSMGAVHLNQPVNGLVPTRDNRGYWLVASDGGVFTFGDAAFFGSMGNVRLNQPVVGMTRYDDAYLMVARDGGVFLFGSGIFWGSLGGAPSPEPIVGIAANS